MNHFLFAILAMALKHDKCRLELFTNPKKKGEPMARCLMPISYAVVLENVIHAHQKKDGEVPITIELLPLKNRAKSAAYLVMPMDYKPSISKAIDAHNARLKRKAAKIQDVYPKKVPSKKRTASEAEIVSSPPSAKKAKKTKKPKEVKEVKKVLL